MTTLLFRPSTKKEIVIYDQNVFNK